MNSARKEARESHSLAYSSWNLRPYFVSIQAKILYN